MITSVEGMSIHSKKEEYFISIPRKLVTADSAAELEALKSANDNYFDLLEIIEKKRKFELKYMVPEEWKTLHSARKCNEVLRLSLLDRILHSAILEDECKTILHPQNIFYSDMKHIKYLYRANDVMQKVDNISALEQYKLISYSMLTKYSYEVWRKKKLKLLEKEKNDLLNKIEHAESLSELQTLIEDELNAKEARYFEEEEFRKNIIVRKNKLRTKISIAVICAFIFIGLCGVAAVKLSSDERLNMCKEKYIARETAYKNLLFGDLETATTLIPSCEFTETEMLDWYFMSEDYNTLLELRSDFAPNVVNKLYQDGKQDEILNLDQGNKLAYINMEKSILNNDKSYVVANYATVSDTTQLIRMAEYFIADSNSEYARKVIELITDENVKNELLKRVK